MDNFEKKLILREKFGCSCFYKELNRFCQEEKEFYNWTIREFRKFLVISRPELFEEIVRKCDCVWYKGSCQDKDVLLEHKRIVKQG